MSILGRILGLTPAASTPDTSGTSNPAGWLTDLFGGMMTATGIRVNAQVALSVPGIAACVAVLSDDLAKVPCVIQRKQAAGGWTDATDHPLYPLLHRKPAPWLTSYNWRRAVIANALSRGNGYSRVLRDGAGDVRRVLALRSEQVCVRWTMDGEPVYDVSRSATNTPDGPGRQSPYLEPNLSYQEVLHLAYAGTTEAGLNGGVMGVSPIARHQEAVALAVAAERFAAAFFRNGARPSAVIEMEHKLPNDETAKRIRAGLERAYGGLDNSFKIAILELGMKLKEFSYSNAESQLVEVRKEQAVQFCQMFRIPPHKVGILDRATFSNIEHQGIEYVTGPVSALASALEQALELTCLTEREQDEYRIRLDLDELTRGDIQARYRSYAVGRQWGWLNVDEIREFEDMNPLPGDAGKVYLTPMNMAPSDRLDDIVDKQVEPDPAPNQPKRNPNAPPAAPTRRKNALVGPDGLPLETEE